MDSKYGKSDSGSQTVSFRIGYEGKPDKAIETALYAFDAQGRLLASAPLKEGAGALRVTAGQLRQARLFVAPVLHAQRQQTPTLRTMAHLNAYEPVWHYKPGADMYELQPVPDALWPTWFWCSCRVRGRVVKQETLGGVTYESPVCYARVHICEVDRLPWIIAQLPDPIVFRLRDELLIALERPFPDPNPPDPPYALDPAVIDPQPVFKQAAGVFGKHAASAVMFNPQPEPPGDPLMQAAKGARNLDAVMLNPQPLPPKALTAGAGFPLRSTLMSHAVSQVREALIQNVALIKVFWCDWHWLSPYILPWYTYDCEELAVVETDANGRFDTTIWYPCPGDHPDLYFWVEASIGGTWTTVYKPSIRCHTYWNFACGSEVTIRVTDPRVHGCGDHPELLGLKVVVKTIGRQVSMGEIYRDSLVPSEKAKEGQVTEGWIDATKPSPFGAVLEPRVDFGSGLKAAGITHYRWSHRPLGSVDEADWAVIDAPVSRHYREATPPMSPVIYKSLQIGPDTTVAGFFTLIDPDLPANAEDWEVLDEGYDLASAYFDTTLLPPGKRELKLELFRQVGAVMTRVDLTAEGVELYEITDPAPLVEGSYVTAAAQADRVLTDGSGHVVAYRLVVHADNRVCFGTINDVTINGTPAGPCGFLEYTDRNDAVHLAFRASHPDNFASFYFRTVRVSTDVVEAGAGGLVEAVNANGFVRAGDTFSKDLTVQTLMTSGLAADEVACTRAAFAESLHVYALATNGYGRLSNLDAPRTWEDPAQISLRAFAIAHA